MRAVRCVDGRATVLDVPAPSGEGVRVTMVSSGVCGSDLHMLELGFFDRFTIGHEFAGYTDNGRAVAVEPIRGCAVCELCRAGDYNRCPETLNNICGITLDGGMADEVMVAPDMLVPLPAGVDPRNACLVEPLGVAVHGFRLAGLRGDTRVAVIGGGSIGQAALAVARTAGCETAVAARHDAQREAADRLGAAPLTGEPYDIVVDAAGTASALTEAAARCRPGGTMLLLAAYWEGLELPFADVFMKELTVVPSSMYGRAGAVRDMEAAASVLAAVPEMPDAVITHRFPLDAAEEAFATANNRAAGAIKVVLEP